MKVELNGKYELSIYSESWVEEIALKAWFDRWVKSKNDGNEASLLIHTFTEDDKLIQLVVESRDEE